MVRKNAKYSWDAMLGAARAQPGEFILAFRNAPVTLAKRIRTRDASALKGLPEGALTVARDGETLHMVDGVPHVDLYVRWNLDKNGQPLPGLSRGDGLRRRQVPTAERRMELAERLAKIPELPNVAVDPVIEAVMAWYDRG